LGALLGGRKEARVLNGNGGMAREPDETEQNSLGGRVRRYAQVTGRVGGLAARVAGARIVFAARGRAARLQAGADADARAAASLLEEGDIYIPVTVILELEWILRSRYCYSASTIAAEEPRVTGTSVSGFTEMP